MRRFRRILLVLLAIICALVLGLLAWRALEQAHIAAALRIAAPPGIDELEAVDLGGLPQWISIRGHDRRKPLLLFLHGGPGFPQMPFMKNNALLEEDFVVVQWDERGAGKTFDPDTPGATMNLEQLVGDAHQLVQILRGRFGGQRIFLCAHSYGTLVGA
ncbi:MAG TPA: alpha/beta hydrolase, partial [Chthoniobacterales bacterium]